MNEFSLFFYKVDIDKKKLADEFFLNLFIIDYVVI